jgi:hypothetical protein
MLSLTTGSPPYLLRWTTYLTSALSGESDYQYVVEEDEDFVQFPSEDHNEDDAPLAAATASRSATITKAQDLHYQTLISNTVQRSTLIPTMGSQATTVFHQKREEQPPSPSSRLLVQSPEGGSSAYGSDTVLAVGEIK